MYDCLKRTAVFLCYIPFVAMLLSGMAYFNVQTIIIAAAAIICIMGIYRLCASAETGQALKIQLVLQVVTFVLLLVAGYCLAVEPAWDFGRIYHGALDITTNGRLTYTMPYYLESYNNFFITLCLVPWLKICSVFGIHPLYSGILLNVTAIATAQIFAVWAANIDVSYQHGLFLQICFTLFLPFYSYAPIFYTDTLSMPFVTFGLLVYFLVKNKKVGGKMGLVLYTAAGIACFIGYKLKPTAAAIYIAMAIISFLNKDRENLKNIIAMVAVMVLCFAGYGLFETKTDIIDLTDIDAHRLPPEHYVMMGLKGNGGYNPQDHAFTLSFDNIQDRKSADIQEIKNRLEDYGPDGYAAFLLKKIHYTWMDGTYFAPHKLDIDAVRDNMVSSLFRASGVYNGVYRLFMDSIQLVLILFMLSGTSGRKDISLISSMCVFALFAFLLVWETRSRYIVNYIPVFLLLAGLGVSVTGGRKQIYNKENKTGGLQ